MLNELVRVYPESLWVKDYCGRSAMELVEILQLMLHEEEEEEEGRHVVEEEMKPSLKCMDSAFLSRLMFLRLKWRRKCSVMMISSVNTSNKLQRQTSKLP